MSKICNVNDLKVSLSASVSCMDLGHMSDEIKAVETSVVDFFHYDVVDGMFNSCYILGDAMLGYLKKSSCLPVEVHLAVKKPAEYIEIFGAAGADFIAVHYESDGSVERNFDLIKKAGAVPVLAYRAETAPGEDFTYLAEKSAWILKLTVNPGFSGQIIKPSAIEHIRLMRQQLAEAGLRTRIQADGNVNEVTIWRLYEAGARIFTGGTSGLFKKDLSVAGNARRLIDAIHGEE